MRITKVVDFAAAHSIAGAGKCANKHGHNWEATIIVDCHNDVLDDHGFIVDVRDIKHAAYKYDHDDLDKYFAMPSTEHVAERIAKDALAVCLETNPRGIFTVQVHLVETKNNSADAVASNVLGTLQKDYFKEVGLQGAKQDEKNPRLGKDYNVS